MQQFLPDERLVFVDVEVAGGESWRPIIQIAAVVVDSRLAELECYEAKLAFNTKYADPEYLFNGKYEPGFWHEEAKPPQVVQDDFSALLKRHATTDQCGTSGRVFQVAQMVAHNAAFDSVVLLAWYRRFGQYLPASPRVFCTMQRAMWLFHERKELTPATDFKLGTLCEYFGVPLSEEQAHDALNDVRATVELYRAMQQVVDSTNCG